MTNSPSPLAQKKIISVDIAILIGQLFVNLPVFIITRVI